MDKTKAGYVRLTGFLALSIVLILLLSTPGMIFSKGVDLIDTELSRRSGHEFYVQTALDFGDRASLATLPKEFGNWSMSHEYNWNALAERLNVSLMLCRDYAKPGLYIPVNLLVARSKETNTSGFHPPIVCYPALGYTIVNGEVNPTPYRFFDHEQHLGETEEMEVANVSWITKPLFGGEEMQNVTIPVKKLVIEKYDDGGNVIKRGVVLYFYVKTDRWGITEEFTFIRVEATFAPTQGNWSEAVEGTTAVCEGLMSELFPKLFKLREPEEMIIVAMAKEGGALGVAAAVVLIDIPLAVILYPSIRNLSEKRIEKRLQKR